ncbi:MAG TPA: bifunctional DNA primase/polymerase [Acidimicrobiales bacterium]|nr:bifunctional DNA primase/polymerase [Acidimicrobiales bacterium]
MTTHLDHALYYARELSWPVFPVAPRGKLPLLPSAHARGEPPCRGECGREGHGLHDATTDETTIRRWWGKCPDASIGLRTGVAFDVVDIDGPEGLAALNATRADRPITWGPESITGGGGWHLFHLPTGGGNRAKIVEHVDYRGAGGYIVAPPSVHPSGERYFWAPGAGPDEPLEPLAGWLRELVLPPSQEHGVAVPIHRRPPERLNAYATRAFESELGRVALASVGERNHQLNKSAFALGQLIAGGALPLELVVDRLIEAAARAGLTGREVEATIASGLRSGARQPRRVPA